ncbi:putative 3'-5' exonuclease domain, mut7-C RNAse domain, ribonuclease H-like superfamily [Helianthus anomalus]
MEAGGCDIHVVSSTDSPEFGRFKWAVSHSSIIGLDAEWKPVRVHQATFPPVLLLQMACRLLNQEDSLVVFLLDLSQLPLAEIHHLLTHVFLSPNILKLGFRFKQDLLYLSSTFRSHSGGGGGFHRVEPYLDIASIYSSHLHHHKQTRKKTNSLSSICQELLGISLSKELQCSDWSLRPLTQHQITYAALDALCLIHIFHVFQQRLLKQGTIQSLTEVEYSDLNLGLKQILREPDNSSRILRTRYCEAVEMVRATILEYPRRQLEASLKKSSWDSSIIPPMDYTLLQIVRQYGDKLILTESDGKPRTSKKKGKRKSSTGFTCKEKQVDTIDDWQGPPPWDSLLGGDGCPKFLCDVMVEGLAKHLRCVGIDAAVPYSKKPETRELIDQAIKEKRVILTRDAKLLRHEYLLRNQIYRVRNLLKNDQLLEVIETFELKICEDQLMSRCTKCNGKFIQKPLSIEEALEAAKGFQVIPNCLFDRNIEFWQCTDCNQLYWEGTQYHNAVQKFIDVCKITSTGSLG